MTTPPLPSNGAPRWYNILLIALALLFIGQYLYVVVSRIAYPYELEWMEGASVDTFARVLRGAPLYVAPSIDYIPPIYGPAYFYLGALFPLLFGVNLFSVRLLSVAASIGVLVLMFRWIRQEGGGVSTAIFACGLFAACFEALGGWFDLGRVDSPYLFCLMLGGYTLRFAEGKRWLILSAVWLSMATFIKVNAVIVIIFLIPFVLLTYRARALVWLGTLGIIGGGVTALFTLISGEWFLYFVLARSQDAILPPSEWLEFWTNDLTMIWLPLLLAITYIVWLGRTKQLGAFRFYVYYALGMILAAWFSRIHHGSWVNVNFSAYAVLILMAGIGLSRELEGFKRPVWRIGVIVVIGFQFWLLRFDAHRHLPDATDQTAGEAFVSRLSGVDGEVLLFAHGYYPQLANVSAPESGWLMNMSHGERVGAKAAFDDNVISAIQARRFAVIVTDNAIYLHEGYLDVLQANYEAQDIQFEGAAFFPVEGQQTRPLQWWTPR